MASSLAPGGRVEGVWAGGCESVCVCVCRGGSFQFARSAGDSSSAAAASTWCSQGVSLVQRQLL